MSFFKHRPPEETEEILELAKFIGDYNMQKGSIDERYLPYGKEDAESIYDAGYRKPAPREQYIRQIQIQKAGEVTALLPLSFTVERMEQNGTIKKCFL